MLGPDLLANEAAIVELVKRTTQTGPDKWARRVETRDYLATVAEENQVAPAVYVVYDGIVVLDSSQHQAALGNRWLVVIVVSTARAMSESAPRNEIAGPYMGQVMQALHGQLLPQCSGPLQVVTGPRPFYSPGGKFAYFPLAFIAPAIFSPRIGGMAGARATPRN